MGNSQTTGVLITPPDTLRKKVGGRLGPANKAAIAKAEAALANLADNFDEWMTLEVTKLEDTRNVVRNEGIGGDAGQKLFNVSHDIKGLGTTYGYPLVSSIADSLCKITLELDVRAKAPLSLVNAHVDSIRAVVRGHIKTTNNPVGQSLVKELSERATKFLATV